MKYSDTISGNASYHIPEDLRLLGIGITVTGKVIAANCENSQKMTGPHTPSRLSGKNAVNHGLLSKYLAFANEEESAQYDPS
jgi:hypothetical protein